MATDKTLLLVVGAGVLFTERKFEGVNHCGFEFSISCDRGGDKK
jgi:hypothetical protein